MSDDWVNEESNKQATLDLGVQPAVEPSVEPVAEVATVEAATDPSFVRVTVDMTPKEVVRLDEDGAKLLFDDGIDTFLRLDDESFRKLSIINRQRYSLAQGDWKFKQLEYQMPDLSELSVSGQFSLASRRLSVDGRRPDRHYTFKRPNNLKRLLASGYRVVTDAAVKTADSTPGGTKIVNDGGAVEQVLMEIPLERKLMLDREKTERNRVWEEGHDREVERELSSTMKGASAYDPTKDTRPRHFTPAAES